MYSGYGYGSGYGIRVRRTAAGGDDSGGYPYNYGAHGIRRRMMWAKARIRLKVKPRDAKVYVDGYFVGMVDSSTARSRS